MEQNEMELEERCIILRIPKDAVRLTVKATVLIGGEKIKAKKKLSAEEIQKARQDFLENVEDGDDYDAMLVLTERGMKLAKALAAGEADETT